MLCPGNYNDVKILDICLKLIFLEIMYKKIVHMLLNCRCLGLNLGMNGLYGYKAAESLDTEWCLILTKPDAYS